MHKVFVYGSLKQGLRYSYYMKDAKFIGELAITHHRLRTIGMIPIIEKTTNANDICVGEVYEVSDELKKRLDYFEATAAYTSCPLPEHKDITYYYNERYHFNDKPLIVKDNHGRYNWNIEHQERELSA